MATATTTVRKSKTLVKDIEGGHQDAIVTMILRFCVAVHDSDDVTRVAAQYVFPDELTTVLDDIAANEGEAGLRRVATAAGARVKHLSTTVQAAGMPFPPHVLATPAGLPQDAAIVDWGTVVDAIQIVLHNQIISDVQNDTPDRHANSVIPTGDKQPAKTARRFVPKQHDEFVTLNNTQLKYRRDDFIGKTVTIDKSDSNKVKAPVECTVTGIGPKAVKLHKVTGTDDVVFVTRGTNDALLKRIVIQHNIPKHLG